jgi:feruloyl esterase
LSEAQRFPADFDGIVAGDPAFNVRLGGIANIWDAQHLFGTDGTPVIRPEGLILLHRAVLAACDGLDGLVDGIIADPRRCHFDVGRLACPPGGSIGCLRADEVAAAKGVYGGPHDSRGRRLIPGHGLFGSEIQWDSPKPIDLAQGNVSYLDFWPNPPASFSYRNFDFDRDVPRVRAQAALYDPVAPYTAPDLDEFHRRGGKLILYQGWADSGVSALMILDYRAQVLRRERGRSIDGWLRLFMVPGMFHCRGGDAPNLFDPLPSLVDWVEHGEAPERIVATQKRGATVLRTRPLVPYPDEARYTGRGEPNDAQNWIAVRPALLPDDRVDWAWAPPQQPQQKLP